MSTTPNLNLELTPTNPSMNFTEWRTLINGESDSNMMKIDVGFGKKSDKTIINENTANDESSTYILEHNTEIRFLEASNYLKITLPENTPNDYISSVIFTTNNLLTFVYPSEIYMFGVDCIDGIFVPIENKRYSIYFEYDGEYINGFVSGVSTV